MFAVHILPQIRWKRIPHTFRPETTLLFIYITLFTFLPFFFSNFYFNVFYTPANVTNLDDLVEKAADQPVETGSVLVLGHVQDGGEARYEAVDQRRDALRIAGEAGQRLQRLCTLVDRQLVCSNRPPTHMATSRY